jgi:hypothetical protein
VRQERRNDKREDGRRKDLFNTTATHFLVDSKSGIEYDGFEKGNGKGIQLWRFVFA